MGIFYKDCPHCATTHAASTDMCGCGYAFNGEKLEEPHRVPGLVAQEEKLYEAYLAARLEQAVAEAQQAQIAIHTGYQTPQNIARAEETVKTLAQVKADFEAQAKKTAEAVKMAEIAKTTLAIKHRSAGKTVRAVSSVSTLPARKTHHSAAPLEKAGKRAHTSTKVRPKKPNTTDPRRLQTKQVERARAQAGYVRQTEQARSEAEKVKRAEEERVRIENTRKIEQAKIQAEQLRQAERARDAEKLKRTEDARIQAEDARKLEQAKIQTEQLRLAEHARSTAEKIKRAEEAQILAKQARQAEEARIQADKVKQAEYAAARAYLSAQTAKAEQALKTAQADKIREQTLAQGGAFKAAQAAKAAQIMLNNAKECPNCTGMVPHHRNQCGCGYTFTSGENELPGLPLSPMETKELFSLISSKSIKST